MKTKFAMRDKILTNRFNMKLGRATEAYKMLLREQQKRYPCSWKEDYKEVSIVQSPTLMYKFNIPVKMPSKFFKEGNKQTKFLNS